MGLKTKSLMKLISLADLKTDNSIEILIEFMSNLFKRDELGERYLNFEL